MQDEAPGPRDTHRPKSDHVAKYRAASICCRACIVTYLPALRAPLELQRRKLEGARTEQRL
jgi:hypothetical protein